MKRETTCNPPPQDYQIFNDIVSGTTATSRNLRRDALNDSSDLR